MSQPIGILVEGRFPVCIRIGSVRLLGLLQRFSDLLSRGCARLASEVDGLFDICLGFNQKELARRGFWRDRPSAGRYAARTSEGEFFSSPIPSRFKNSPS